MDAVARILQPALSDALQQQVIIENIGGAGGMLGAARVAKSAPDGYQFVLGNVGTHAVSQTLYKKPLYNSATDFSPVVLIADLSLVMVARKDLPPNNLQEFITYAKANQKTMQFASAGAGSATHLGCALINAQIGVNVTHIPYRGGAPAMQDLIAQRVDYLCIDTPVAAPQILSGSIKPIAILSRGRSPSLPNLASADEQGLTGFEASNWSAFFLPKDTPAAIVQKPGTSEMIVADAVAAEELKLGNTMPTGTYLDMCVHLPLVDPEKIACPVQIIRGEHDGIATIHDILAFFEKVANPDKQFTVLPGSAHIAQFGLNFGRFYHVLFGFLRMPARVDVSV